MKQALLIFFLLFCQLLQADQSCDSFLNLQTKFNLTERSEFVRSKDLNSILDDDSKTWIQTRHNEYRAYKFIPGKKNKPLVVFMMGLGGSIEETLLKNQILKDYLRLQHPVLILEGSKLGDTALLNQRIDFKSDFRTNMEGYEDLFSVFLKEHDLSFSSLILSGHSYGAYGASHLSTKIKDLIEALRPELGPLEISLQLFAPAVTNLNNRLNPNWINKLHGSLSGYFDMMKSNSGYKLKVKQVSQALLGSIPSLIDDPLKLIMSSELTVDAGQEHIFDILKNADSSIRIEIYLGSEENVLFPMMHLELFELLHERSGNVSLILVQDQDHFLTDKVSLKQTRAITKFKVPQKSQLEQDQIIRTNSFYWISNTGKISIIESEELNLLLQAQSLKLWDYFIASQKFRYVYFGAIPVRELNSYFPSEWRP